MVLRKTTVLRGTQVKTDKKTSILQVIILIIISLLIVLFSYSIFSFNILHYTSFLNADVSSETVLVREMWNNKTIVPSSWIPSSERRILSTCSLAAPIYGITGNMNLSLGISCCLMTLLLIICFAILMRNTSFGRVPIMMGILVLLALPATMEILTTLYLLCGYYITVSVIMLFTLNIYVSAANGRIKQYQVWLILCSLMAYAISLSGMRGILVIYFPLFATELVRWFVYVARNKRLPAKTKEYSRTALMTLVMLVLAYLGTRSEYAIVMETSRNIRGGFRKLITEAWPSFLQCINITGTTGLHNVLLIVILVICSAVMIVYLIFNKRVDHAQLLTLGFFWMSLVVVFLSNSFTTTAVSARYYFSVFFIVAYSFACLSGVFQKRLNSFSKTCRVFSRCASISLIVVVGIVTIQNWKSIYYPVITEKDDQHSEQNQIVACLEEKNCKYCYTSFENANSLTVLSNGKVQGAAIDDFSEMNISKWLTSTDWYCPNAEYDAPTAYLITASAQESFDGFMSEHNDITILLETENYKLYYSPHNYSNLG